jgi:hypothetical protein
VSQGRLNLSPQLSVEPTYVSNWVTLPDSRSTTHLAGTRVPPASPGEFARAPPDVLLGIVGIDGLIVVRQARRDQFGQIKIDLVDAAILDLRRQVRTAALNSREYLRYSSNPPAAAPRRGERSPSSCPSPN